MKKETLPKNGHFIIMWALIIFFMFYFNKQSLLLFCISSFPMYLIFYYYSNSLVIDDNKITIKKTAFPFAKLRSYTTEEIESLQIEIGRDFKIGMTLKNGARKAYVFKFSPKECKQLISILSQLIKNISINGNPIPLSL